MYAVRRVDLDKKYPKFNAVRRITRPTKTQNQDDKQCTLCAFYGLLYTLKYLLLFNFRYVRPRYQWANL